VPSDRPDASDVRNEDAGVAALDATFRLVLPELPPAFFPITSQDDLERKLLGRVVRLEIDRQVDAAEPQPPEGDRTTSA
jgi:hypothetical protein